MIAGRTRDIPRISSYRDIPASLHTATSPASHPTLGYKIPSFVYISRMTIALPHYFCTGLSLHPFLIPPQSRTMRKSYLVLILSALAITIVLLLTACSKAGPKGASGPAGPIGPAGQQGTPGQTDSLYGPKTLSGWGTGISLQGTAGAAGTPGAAGACCRPSFLTLLSPTGSQREDLTAEFVISRIPMVNFLAIGCPG